MSALSEDIAYDCFGANLQEQGRGFYVTLELLAIVRGCLEAGLPLLDPKADELRYERRSHDFARRLPHADEPGFFGAEHLAHLGDDERTLRTLSALVESLTVPVPGRRARPTFKLRLLYPYAGDLVHYDAVDRKRPGGGIAIHVQQYNMRGAGGLAHKILRRDPNDQRRARTAEGLKRLVEDSDTPLGRLARALAAHDEKQNSPYTDQREARAWPNADLSPWPELICAGVNRIVRRGEAPHARRVRMLLYWVPFCVAMHELSLSAARLGKLRPVIPVDCVDRGASALRRISRAALADARTLIGDSIADALAERALSEGQPKPTAQDARREAKSPLSFFTTTLGAVGALNALAGLRHFVLRPPLIEAICAATLEPGAEMEFEAFCEEVLYGRLGLVTDPESAAQAELTRAVDRAEFADGADALARDLASLGLLLEYSDATRLVHGEVA